jgi:hypothetical protein
MSSPISSIVEVNITQNTQTVSQVSFSIPAIFGPTVTAGGPIQYFSTLAGMIAAGYTTGNPEYVRAQEILSQPLTPTEFAVGQYSAAVEQVDTISVNTLGGSGTVYDFDLNGTIISVTGGVNQQTVLGSLLTAIGVAFPTNPPVTGSVGGSGSGALLTLTSSVAGAPVAYTSLTSNLTHANVTPNHSIANDIATAQAVNGGDDWYGLTICSQVASDIEQVAAYIETQLKIFIADSTDANILTASTTDVASVLQGKSYKRTGIIYAGTANDGRAAAWLGGQLPQVPGSNTWMFVTLVGITPDFLNQTQIQNCIGIPLAGVSGKNCNIYQTVGGVGITQQGFMSGGQFIDQTVGVDWLQSTMQSNIFSQLVNSPKIPYTDQGVAVIENAIRQTLLQGVANGLIDGTSPIIVTAPLVANIPQVDRAARLLPSVTFSCRLAGAIQDIIINGTVSV